MCIIDDVVLCERKNYSLSYDNKRLAEYKEFLKGKTASVIGVGISNIPLIGFLLDNGVKVIARDMKSFAELCAINPQVEKLSQRGASFVTKVPTYALTTKKYLRQRKREVL